MTIRLLTSDCRELLPTLADASVQCVVTSPPYFGLRDYGTARWEGGDVACSHEVVDPRSSRPLGVFHGGDDRFHVHPYRDTCGRCGARRIDAQLGLEPTPDAYIAAMVGVFREVRRVLRDDGTCWVNMGDSYANTGNTSQTDFSASSVGYGGRGRGVLGGQPGKQIPSGLKPKDLLLMPARLALALQADGWWVRSDIIWSKPNPMPESCTDRPTSAHEHVFLLTKLARYFYDADAVREEGTIAAGTLGAKGSEERFALAGVNSRPPEYKVYSGTRNLRNVWTIATAPYAQAHFATFPPELAERCIRAGTSERGCCAACGAPWVRVTEASYQKLTGSSGRNDQTGSNGWDGGGYPRMDKRVTTTGWSASCQCEAATVPCTVLDPFSGAGTALLVADRLGRDAIGIDLSHAYVEMTRERLTVDCPLFMAFEASPPPAEDPEDARMADLFQDMAAD